MAGITLLENEKAVRHPYGITTERRKAARDSRNKGKPIGMADAWVAAVAVMFDITLVTHNRKHYENVENLKIISESPAP